MITIDQTSFKCGHHLILKEDINKAISIDQRSEMLLKLSKLQR